MWCWCSGLLVFWCCSSVLVVFWCSGEVLLLFRWCSGLLALFWCSELLVFWRCFSVLVELWWCSGGSGGRKEEHQNTTRIPELHQNTRTPPEDLQNTTRQKNSSGVLVVFWCFGGVPVVWWCSGLLVFWWCSSVLVVNGRTPYTFVFSEQLRTVRTAVPYWPKIAVRRTSFSYIYLRTLPYLIFITSVPG